MAEETTTTTTETIDYKAEYEKMQNDYAKLKSNFDKASSEIAENKRKDRERMSEEDKRKAENEEREIRYKELERKLAMRDYADELGYVGDEKAKNAIVEEFAEGNIVSGLKKLKEFMSKDKVEMEKRIKDELLKTNPQSNPQSTNSGAITQEQFKNMGVAERTKLYNENKELYLKLSKN